MPSHFCAPNLLTACAGRAWKILPTLQSAAVTFGVGKGEWENQVRLRQVIENLWAHCITWGRLARLHELFSRHFGQASYVGEQGFPNYGMGTIKPSILLFQGFLGLAQGEALILTSEEPQSLFQLPLLFEGYFLQCSVCPSLLQNSLQIN